MNRQRQEENFVHVFCKAYRKYNFQFLPNHVAKITSDYLI
jgi:hypothetical protein